MELIEMKKVFAVSAVTAACMLAANAGAEEGKSGFYLTGKAGTSAVKYRGGMAITRYSVEV